MRQGLIGPLRPASRPTAVPDGATVILNSGAVVGGRTDPASWWLEVDSQDRRLTWQRLPGPSPPSLTPQVTS